MKKIGSATIVVILFSIVFMLYASSTYADVRHMKNQYNQYEKDIIQKYENQYNNKIQEL